MTTAINEFDSQLARRVGSGTAPAGGVTHWNGFDGDVFGTLRNIYDFGLSDDPAADNSWGMPQGARYFASQDNGGFGTFNDLFFEKDPPFNADGRVGAWVTVRTAGAASGNLGFRTDTIYIPGFTGFVPNDTTWTDRGLITADGTTTIKQTGDPYWQVRRNVANFFGNDPVSLPPGAGGRRQVGYVADDVWFGGNFANGVQQARLLSGWGQEFLFVRPQYPGITPALGGVMSDADVFTAAGDGTGLWLLFGDQGHYDNSRLRGQYNTHMTTADPFGPWQLDLWCFDGVDVYQVAKLDHVIGLGLLRGGLQLPAQDTTTAPTSDLNTIKMEWDPTVGKIMVSINGGAWAALSTVS